MPGCPHRAPRVAFQGKILDVAPIINLVRLETMKNLMYGDMRILVTDDVADAILHYAAILAQIRASDVVAVPTVD